MAALPKRPPKRPPDRGKQGWTPRRRPTHQPVKHSARGNRSLHDGPPHSRQGSRRRAMTGLEDETSPTLISSASGTHSAAALYTGAYHKPLPPFPGLQYFGGSKPKPKPKPGRMPKPEPPDPLVTEEDN